MVKRVLMLKLEFSVSAEIKTPTWKSLISKPRLFLRMSVVKDLTRRDPIFKSEESSNIVWIPHRVQFIIESYCDSTQYKSTNIFSLRIVKTTTKHSRRE